MSESWSGRRNAELYDTFARTFPMYVQSSAALVRVAELGPGERVVDLCCGTGVTTEAVLQCVGPDGLVWSVDGSEDMLDLAKRHIDAPNVVFVLWPAESFHLAIEGPADAIVCNSAFWQTDMHQALASAKRILRPGGRIAFNVSSEMVKRAPHAGDVTTLRESALNRRMFEIAMSEYDYTPPRRRRMGLLEPRSLEDWTADLAAAGFELERHEITHSDATTESVYEWLRVPIFSTRLLPGLPYDLKMEIFERAYKEVAYPEASVGEWVHFVAHRR